MQTLHKQRSAQTRRRISETISRGKFIVIEGGVACGKSTQVALLKKKFPKWKYFYEPGSTPFGEKIRDAVQGINNYKVDPYAALFGYAASRANLIRAVIKPLLSEGKNVVLDRYWYSTYAYQGSEGVSKKTIIDLNKIATDNLKPDVIIHYDLDPKVGFERKGKKDNLDRYDIKKNIFHNKVRKNYKELSRMFPRIWKIIDASKSIEEIHEVTLKTLNKIDLH